MDSKVNIVAETSDEVVVKVVTLNPAVKVSKASDNNDNDVLNDNETFSVDNDDPIEEEILPTAKVEQENDEGIVDEDSFKDDSKLEDQTSDQTYSSSVNDSLTENFGSLTTVEDQQQQQEELVTPPTERSPEPQDYSPSPPSSSTSKTTKSSSSSSSKKKRKSNDFKPTVVKPFSFQMDKRVEDRQKYNERVQKMQKAQEERERLERERKEREEERLYQEERKKTIPKANPVRHYKSITITPSKKQLTMPEAPKLCLESRNRTPKVADKFESPPRGSNKLKQVL